jgi:aminoglycoside 3-N-acetyltransferase
MDLERVVTRRRITDDLLALGVSPGDLIMSHESVRSVGWVVGGPEEVGHAILDAIGPGGTWMKYVSSEDTPYELAIWPPEVQRAYRESFPPFDPQRTRAHRKWGILTEYLRTWPGAMRSNHPEGSFAAVGPLASALTSDHPLQDGLGPGSPLEKFLLHNGKVLLLGSPLSDVTVLHYAEYQADVPNKRRVHYEARMLDASGQGVWMNVTELDSSNGIAPYEGGDYFEAIVTEFRDRGLGSTGKVGHSSACLFDGRALCAFGKEWMEKHLAPT